MQQNPFVNDVQLKFLLWCFQNLSAMDGKEVPFVDDEIELESHKVTEEQQHLLVAYAQFAFTFYGKTLMCS